jgi:urease accessory protein
MLTVATLPMPPAPSRISVTSDETVWQLVDATFPAGGFVHSAGLEVQLRWNRVTDGATLKELIRHHLVHTGRSVVPFVSESYLYPDRLKSLDSDFDVFLSNHVANRASRAQGRAFLTAAAIAFQHSGVNRDKEQSGKRNSGEFLRHRWITELSGAMREGDLRIHYPVIWGCVTRLLAVTHETALRLFLYTAVRDLLSAAVRLNIIGPLEAQALQFELAPYSKRVGMKCRSLRVSDAVQTASLLDLLHGTHDRLYTRLFQS